MKSATNRHRPKRITLNGKPWRLQWRAPRKSEDAIALCHKDERRIQVSPNLDNKTLVSALADEICHAHFPQLDNEYVDSFSNDIAAVLDRCGLIKED